MTATGKCVLIVADDMIDAISHRNMFGHPFLTPNLDALRAGATTFDSCNCIIPICLPSRRAFLTGWSPASSGVLANMDIDLDWATVPARDTVFSILRRQGAWVAGYGKLFHQYGPPPKQFLDQVFDDVMATFSFQPDTTPGAPGVTVFLDGADCVGVEGKDAEFYDYQVAQRAIDALATLPADKPWMIGAGFKHPHSTLEAPKWAYDAIDRSQIVVPAGWMTKPYPNTFAQRYTPTSSLSPQRSSPETWAYRVQSYMAAVYHMDHHLGRILAAISARPDANEISIIFTSDHGFSLGHMNWWGKFTQWEESARAPLVVKGPGQTVASVVQTPVTHMDLMPTMLDFMGVPIPSRIKGQSLRPLLPGQSGTYEDRGAVTFIHGTISLRHGPYRYILYPDHPESEELYNVVTDIGQATNLVATQPALAAEMRSRAVLEMARYDMVQASHLLPSPKAAAEYALYGGEAAVGGHGDDIYGLYGSATPSQITDSGGRDKVKLNGWAAGVTYTLPEGIEDLRVSVSSGGTAGRAPLILNDADNVLTAATGFDVRGKAGNDTILGNGGDAYGDDGDDLIDRSARQWGGAGNDTLAGALHWAEGGDGNDLIHQPRGPARLSGGAGNDTIRGWAYAETLLGGSGSDSLDGYGGNDLLDGGTGADRMWGGDGNDTLRTLGDDQVWGGTGVDRYEIGPAGSVQIGDWEIGEVIDITSWGPVAVTVDQVNPALVYVTDGRRSVMVAAAAPITVAQVQASLVRAT